MKRTAIARVPAQFAVGVTATLAARLTAPPTSPWSDGAPIDPTLVESVECTVFQAGAPVAGFADFSLETSSVIFSALQPWGVDTIGFNFLHLLDGNAFAVAGVLCEVVYTFRLADGGAAALEFFGPVVGLP